MTEHEEEVQIFRVDGVEVTAPTCDHCGERTTEGAAAKLVKDMTEPLCAICEKQVAPKRITITHVGGDKWVWASIEYKDKVSMQLWLTHGSVNVDCHLGCAANVFPAFYKAADAPKS